MLLVQCSLQHAVRLSTGYCHEGLLPKTKLSSYVEVCTQDHNRHEGRSNPLDDVVNYVNISRVLLGENSVSYTVYPASREGRVLGTHQSQSVLLVELSVCNL